MDAFRSRNTHARSPTDGLEIPVDKKYGGLGTLYFNTLQENLDKINQVDTVTGITETNGSVRTRAIQLAIELRYSGVIENDIILICSRCHADQTIVILATLFLGAIVAPLDAELSHKECVKRLQKLKPKFCFCDLRPLKQIERVIQESSMTVKLVHFGAQPENDSVVFRRLLNRKFNENFKPLFITSPHKHVAFILPTQGVTGPPKLVCLSHHSIYAQTSMVLDMLNCPEKIITFYPLTWVIQAVVTCLTFSMPIIRILTGPFSERTACKLIHDLKVDNAFFCTDMALKVVDHVAVRDFSLASLKCIFVDTHPGTNIKMQHITSRLRKIKFIQTYSTTESGIITGCSPRYYDEFLEKCGSVGRVLQNCRFQIVDMDTGSVLGPEKCGELMVSSEAMMLGYLKDMDLTKSVMDKEFFRTGDMGKFDLDGWLFIEGRISDLIYIDGGRIMPRKIEETIMMHPYVKEVAVIGDDREILACVTLKPEVTLDEEKLMKFIKEKLPEAFWPTKIIFIDILPLTNVGKIKMSILREELLKFKIEHSESIATVRRVMR